MKIYKYPLQATDCQKVEIPTTSKVLSVALSNGQPCLYAMVDPNDVSGRIIEVVVVPTGENAVIGDCHFLGTLTIRDVLVYHFFYREV